MESKNHKIIRNFISKEEQSLILDWVNQLSITVDVNNHHLKELRKHINGSLYAYDISKNNVSNYIASFQSGGNSVTDEVPGIIHSLIDKISSTLQIKKENVFLQVIDMKSGKVNPHYDAALNGYVTYKCNISVLCEPYSFMVDGTEMEVGETDLYCFEASLYKHWSKTFFESRRVLLSFGFILPYAELGRTDDEPRIRLSKRIEKYFQSKIYSK